MAAPGEDGSPVSSPSSSSGGPRASSKPWPAPAGGLRVFKELQRLAAACQAGGTVAEVRDLSAKDMEEIRQLHSPPVVVRRTLEAVFLLLNAARAPPRPQAPTWQRVQKMLSNAGFLSRMLNFDASILQQAPVLTGFVAAEYFSAGGGTNAVVRRQSTATFREPDLAQRSFSLRRRTVTLDEVEPLTFDRVHRASRATAALFRWSALVLVQALDPSVLQEREAAKAEVATEAGEVPPPRAAVPMPEPEPDPVPAAEAAPVMLTPTPNQAPQRPNTPLPKLAPEPAPKPRAVLKGNSQPDRHFETLAAFVFGSATLAEEGHMMLQTVAATYCMRRRLQLRLVTCPASIENDALARGRVTVAQEWLVSNGLPIESIMLGKEMRKAAGEPGVICQFLLDNDNVLRDFYLLLAQGEQAADVGTRDTINFSRWMIENFHECVH